MRRRARSVARFDPSGSRARVEPNQDVGKGLGGRLPLLLRRWCAQGDVQRRQGLQRVVLARARNGTMSDRFVVLSGCSGGGKSTLQAELRRRGHATVDEPGRRIVKDESADGGTALPWIDPQLRAARHRRCAGRSGGSARSTRLGLLRSQPGGCGVALEQVAAEPALERFGLLYRYHPTVFLTLAVADIFQHTHEGGGCRRRTAARRSGGAAS